MRLDKSLLRLNPEEEDQSEIPVIEIVEESKDSHVSTDTFAVEKSNSNMIVARKIEDTSSV